MLHRIIHTFITSFGILYSVFYEPYVIVNTGHCCTLTQAPATAVAIATAISMQQYDESPSKNDSRILIRVCGTHIAFSIYPV